MKAEINNFGAPGGYVAVTMENDRIRVAFKASAKTPIEFKHERLSDETGLMSEVDVELMGATLSLTRPIVAAIARWYDTLLQSEQEPLEAIS